MLDKLLSNQAKLVGKDQKLMNDLTGKVKKLREYFTIDENVKKINSLWKNPAMRAKFMKATLTHNIIIAIYREMIQRDIVAYNEEGELTRPLGTIRVILHSYLY